MLVIFPHFSTFFVFQSRFEVSSQQATGLSVSGVNRFRLLEERNQALKLEVAALRQEKQQYRKLVNFLLSPPEFDLLFFSFFISSHRHTQSLFAV